MRTIGPKSEEWYDLKKFILLVKLCVYTGSKVNLRQSMLMAYKLRVTSKCPPTTNQLLVSLWLDVSSFVSHFILNWRSIAIHWWVVFEFQKSFVYNCIICSNILYIENFQKQEVI